MKLEEVNIGLIIEQKLNELGMSKSEFGRRIGVPQQNVNRILDKSSIDTSKLVVISEALDFNFFECFRSVNGDGVVIGDGSMNVGESVSTHGDFSPASVHGNAEVNGCVGAAVLQERVKSLEAVLSEKERLIKVLMERK